MGGKSGGSGYQMMPSFSTQTTTPNPQAGAAYSRFLTRAESTANRPFVPYTGQLVAGMTPDQLQAYEQIRRTQGYSQPYYDTASKWTRGAVESLAPENYGKTVSQYMNPYMENVVNATTANLREQQAQEQQALTQKNIMSGGFGGDRGAVGRAELTRQQNLAYGKTVADLLSQGYTNAQAQAMAGAQMGLSGAQQMAGLGTQGMQSGLAETQALLTGGAQQQALQQLGLDTAYQQWQQEQQFPYAQTSWLGSQLGAIGPELGSTTSGFQYGPVEKKGSSGSGIAGGIMSGIGLLNNIGQAGGITGLLSSIFREDGGRVEMGKGGNPLGGGLYGMDVPEVQKSHGITPAHLSYGIQVGGSSGGGGGHDPAAMGKALAGLFTGTKKKAPEAPAEASPATTETPATTPDTTPVIGPHDFAAGKVMGDIPTPPARPAEPAVGPQDFAAGNYNADSPRLPEGGIYVPQMMEAYPLKDQTYTPTAYDNPLVDRAIRALVSTAGNGWTGPAATVAPLVSAGHDVGNVGVAAGLTPSGAAKAVEAAVPGIGGNISGAFRSPTAKRIMGLGSDIPAEGSHAWNVGVATMPRSAGMAAPPVSSTGQAVRGIGGFPSIGTPEYAAEHMRLFGRPYASGGRAHFLRGGWGDGPVEDEMQGINPRTFHPELSANRDTGDRSMEVRPGDTFNFDRAAAQTRKFEGGYSNDSGGPTMYGISSKAHPGLDVRSITPEQAKSMYKSEYWDAIGADKIENPALRRVAYDTAIISGPNRAKQFLAQSGGDPAKFMDLREGFMNRLVSQNPEKYGAYEKGWANRNAELRRTAGLSGAGAPMAYTANDAAFSPSSNAGLGAINSAIASGNIRTPQTTAPEEVSYEDEQGLFMPKSVGNALLAAGLGTMASRAPTLGQAIGEGGLTGLAAYSEGQAQRQKLAMDEPYRRLQMQNIQSEINKRNYDIESAKAEKASIDEYLKRGSGLDGAGTVAGAPLDITGQGGTTTAGAPVSVIAPQGDQLPANIVQLQRRQEALSREIGSGRVPEKLRAEKNNELNSLNQQIANATKVWELQSAPQREYAKRFNEKEAEGVLKKYDEIVEAGTAASGTQESLTRMLQITQDPNFKPGPGQPYLDPIKKLGVQLGWGNPKATEVNEVFDSLSSKALIDSMGGKFGAGISNEDRNAYDRQLANLRNTKSGAQAIIIESLNFVNRQKDIAKWAEQYRESHGGQLDYKFKTELNKWQELNPLYPSPPPSSPDKRVEGKVYANQNGKRARWMGDHWEPLR